MTYHIVTRLMREINEYYDNIQNSTNFRNMNKDNIKDTNFIIPQNDLILLDQIDLVMINNEITKRKNRFIAIHRILSEPIVLPPNAAQYSGLVRCRLFVLRWKKKAQIFGAARREECLPHCPDNLNASGRGVRLIGSKLFQPGVHWEIHVSKNWSPNS
jgi:hypothetical protein